MKPCIALVLATETEFSTCKLVLQETHRRVTFCGRNCIFLALPLVDVIIQKLDAMGNLDAALTVRDIIRKFHPICVVGVGLCATPDEKGSGRNHADLIVATDIVYYEPEKQMPDETQWRPRIFNPKIPEKLLNTVNVSSSLSHYLHKFLPRGERLELPRKYQGLFASGERVLADEEAVVQLQSKVWSEYQKNVCAIDMESAGIAHSCECSGTKYTIIKAVSDYGTVSKNDRWQKAAAAVSIASVIEWIERFRQDELYALANKDMSDVHVRGDLFDKVMVVAEVAGGILPTRGIAPEEVKDRATDDLVTPWDVFVERFIFKALSDQSIGFLGEEEHNVDISELKEGQWWIVDPVDGTQNLVAGRPEVAISIAYYSAGKLELGVICMPYRGVTVGVSDGQHIEVNGYPWIRRREPAVNLKDAVIALPGDIRRLRNAELQAVLEKVIKEAAGVRITGALAYDLAALALGEIDGRISTSAKIVDVAAGVLLVRNAGGIVTDLDGVPWTPNSTTILAAASNDLHSQILNTVKEARLAAH